MDDDAGRIAADDVTAHKADIGKIEGVLGLPRRRSRDFFYRHRLAGQRRLIDEQVLGGEQAQVGWNHVAGRDRDKIAGDDLFDGDLEISFDGRWACCRGGIPALYARRGLDERAQPGGRLVGTMLLDERRHDRKDHHCGNNRGGPHVAQKIGNRRQREQQSVERIFRAVDELVNDAGAVLPRDLV